jgi:hypothetical protein
MLHCIEPCGLVTFRNMGQFQNIYTCVQAYIQPPPPLRSTGCTPARTRRKNNMCYGWVMLCLYSFIPSSGCSLCGVWSVSMLSMQDVRLSAFAVNWWIFWIIFRFQTCQEAYVHYSKCKTSSEWEKIGNY